MTIAIDRPVQQQLLSVDDFLDRYGGDNRYEGLFYNGEYCVLPTVG